MTTASGNFVMTLKSLMQDRKVAILNRWLHETMATYASDTSNFLNKEKDPFANPVGHALRTGCRGVLDCLLEGIEAEKVCRHLDEIIKIRAIQEFSPSQAVSFVFLLRKAIRTDLDESARTLYSAELAEIDADIDQIALFAFDIYSRCREQVSDLRINEVKRSVAAVIQRFTETEPDPVSVGESGSFGDTKSITSRHGDGVALPGKGARPRGNGGAARSNETASEGDETTLRGEGTKLRGNDK